MQLRRPTVSWRPILPLCPLQLSVLHAASEKVIGMHFMNPVPVMRLVEIIKGYQTDEATLATIEDLTRTIEKVPLVAADYPGFVANRILLPRSTRP